MDLTKACATQLPLSLTKAKTNSRRTGTPEPRYQNKQRSAVTERWA